ncbi:hypothetical protein AB0B20_25755 [Micromonospora sp. NPDC049151]|uniref:hypothetical protein n=1 Tax=Micromonospora sp. NPDC049151 TaxID=3155648 RepID=UPI0033CA422F
MLAERGVIDLDEDGRQSAVDRPDRLMRRSRVVRLVAALLIGAVLGGVGVNELRKSQEERDRVRSVSLVAIPVSAGTGGGDVKGVFQMDGQLAVINTGPAPITLVAVAGEGPGVLVRGTGESLLLRPGGTGWVKVKLRLECATAFGTEPLSMRLSVETADRQASEVAYTVAVAGSVWHLGAERPCEHVLREGQS